MDRFVMSCIRGYKIQFESLPCQQTLPFIPPYDIMEMKCAIEKLVNIGAVEPCSPSADQFVSSYFLVPKSNGSMRFVLNLKKLNEFIVTDHFKMEDIRTATKLVSRDNFMCSIDLQDAYFLVPMHKESQKYLRFVYERSMYQFVCLPFGLSTAPFIFTKILKPVVNRLRGKGFASTIYLDDILCIGSSAVACAKNVEVTLRTLESLGFLVNYKKSDLVPSKICPFLGFVIDSYKMTLELPDQKRKKILEIVEEFSKRKVCVIREFARMIGKLVDACKAIAYGWVYTKNFEREKFLALLIGGDYDAQLVLSDDLQEDFAWWRKNLPRSVNPIRSFRFELEIFSDASKSGWGVFCGDESTHGFWIPSEQKLHINYLELIAVWMGLKCFAKESSNCEILLRVDNTTAIAYVNRMGGVQYPGLNKIARDIWQWCEIRKIWIYASYIASKENVEADRESRVKNIDTEWELSGAAFESIISTFGLPSIDLFATRSNSKCDYYCSWHRDPDAFAIDAFTLDWGTADFYAFPPFALVLRVLRKVISDQACGIVVVPNWPAQPWFPMFMELLVAEPIIFEPHEQLLLSPCRSVLHPLEKSLGLIAGRLSGKLTGEKICRSP